MKGCRTCLRSMQVLRPAGMFIKVLDFHFLGSDARTSYFCELGDVRVRERERDLLQDPHFYVGTLKPL